MRWTIILAKLALTILIATLPAAAGEPSPATTMQFQGRDGSSHTLAELHGHAAVINFWATWCGPCREEMPRLQKLSEEYAGRGVTFVAVSIDDADTQKKIDGVVAKRGFRIPVWTGATEQTLKLLDIGILVPATLVLDESGEVIGRIEGETRDKDLRSRLDWALNGRQGKQPKIVQKNDW